ncbi:hypothetical protein SRB5_39920 [Streptomyces sp. RB5]|uniref:Integral membrane protein n=1 Tax=Streptomyces smaragdinus TaxID=2585196 RepID=A0A7K0CK40_9ACTN|nr:hypothetical protein [Streptomyces smaragdinus]MQY13836.1 hypothetical protein [Streptomyces smaragdinus]
MTATARRAGADLRLLRAAVFTAVCVALSAGGHVLASASAVPLWALGAAFAVVLGVTWAGAGRERSLRAIAGLLTVGQLGLHALFALGQHTDPAPTSGVTAFARKLVCGHSGMPLTEGHARHLVSAAGVDPDRLAPVAAPGGHLGHAAAASSYTLPMLLGHLLAALAAGWLLRRGEAALFRLVRLARPAPRLLGALRLAAALRDGLPYAVGPRPVPRRTRDGAPPADPSVVLAHSVIRRGPPGCGLAA